MVVDTGNGKVLHVGDQIRLRRRCWSGCTIGVCTYNGMKNVHIHTDSGELIDMAVSLQVLESRMLPCADITPPPAF